MATRVRVLTAQTVILLVFLAAWQFLPTIASLRSFSPVFDPFFVSSPTRVLDQLRLMLTGERDTPLIWSFAAPTLVASLGGTLIGMLGGAAFGLLLSNGESLSRVLRPFIVATNAAPRIALIPIVVIILGPTIGASITTAVLVVFFLTFFNAYEGGRSVPLHVLQNAQLLGATPSEVMRRIRLPYVLVWTLVSLPNAVSFGLVGVVTAEILTGTLGIGRLLLVSMTSVNSSLTFAVVIVLSVLGIVLVSISEFAKRRWLHWWTEGK